MMYDSVHCVKLSCAVFLLNMLLFCVELVFECRHLNLVQVAFVVVCFTGSTNDALYRSLKETKFYAAYMYVGEENVGDTAWTVV